MRSASSLLLVAAVAAQETTVDFVGEIAPILQSCVSCHGPDKQKGDLRLDAREHVFGPERDYWVVIPEKPDESSLIERIELPAGHEDLMPAEGDPLRPDQIARLRAWITAGADWPEGGDEFFIAAREAAAVPRIDFGIAAPEPAVQERIDRAIAALKAQGIVAGVVAGDTPAVDVNASLLGDTFGDEDVHLLAELAPVLVWLNLSRTGVTDEALETLKGMPQLRRLNLSRTAVGDVGMKALAGLPKLEVLNAYGTKVTDVGMKNLVAMPALAKVYAFDTAVTDGGAALLETREPPVVVDRGLYVAERLAKAQAEIKDREKRNEPVNTKCPVTDQGVSKNIAVDHEGLRIAFCCGKCKGAFEKEPAKYAAKVAEYKKAAEKK